MRQRAKRMAAWVAAACAALAAFLLLHAAGFGVPCLFHLLTGLDCPGCGATRMAAALLAGRPAEAWRSNPGLLLAAGPLAAATLGCCLHWLRTGDPRPGRWETVLFSLCLAGLLFFGALRNLPWYPY